MILKNYYTILYLILEDSKILNYLRKFSLIFLIIIFFLYYSSNFNIIIDVSELPNNVEYQDKIISKYTLNNNLE
jgi:hypothetical protein